MVTGGWPVAGLGPPVIPAPAPSLRVGACAGRAWSGASGCLPLCSPLCCSPSPGPSWTATFDPVPVDAPTGPQACREKELHSGPPAPQEPRSGPLDLPTPSPAGPAAPSTLQLR